MPVDRLKVDHHPEVRAEAGRAEVVVAVRVEALVRVDLEVVEEAAAVQAEWEETPIPVTSTRSPSVCKLSISLTTSTMGNRMEH